MPSKRKAAKTAKAGTKVKGELTLPKLEMTFPLDAKKVEAIQRCLAKGQLRITVSKIDLLRGRAGDPYIYD
jgi:hypothetical protein